MNKSLIKITRSLYRIPFSLCSCIFDTFICPLSSKHIKLIWISHVANGIYRLMLPFDMKRQFAKEYSKHTHIRSSVHCVWDSPRFAKWFDKMLDWVTEKKLCANIMDDFNVCCLFATYFHFNLMWIMYGHRFERVILNGIRKYATTHTHSRERSKWSETSEKSNSNYGKCI